MKIWSTLIAGSLLLAPLALCAQPVPVHNPVATQAPCAATSDRPLLLRPIKAGYETGARRDLVAARRLGGAHAAAMVMSPSQVRRDIVMKLKNSCN